MGIFSLTQELAIDLGTANTLIIYNGKVVVDEPSIVALDVHTGKVVAIGHQARQMHEKTNPNIKTIRPLKDGVIADFNATELMLRGMIKKVKTSGRSLRPLAAYGDLHPVGFDQRRNPRRARLRRACRRPRGLHDLRADGRGAGRRSRRRGSGRQHGHRHRRRHVGDRLHLAGRHRLLRVDQRGRRRLHQRHPELRAPAAQRPHRRTYGRSDQVCDRCGRTPIWTRSPKTSW